MALLRASLMRWHRRLGLAAALLVLLAAVTGIVINHADALGLPQRHLQAPWLLRLYGIAPPVLRGAWPAGPRWVSQWGTRLALDEQPLPAPEVEQVLGVFALGDWLVVADRQQLVVLGSRGELIDRLAMPAGSAAVRAAAAGSAVVVEAADGRQLRSDEALSTWSAAATPAPATWAVAQSLPAKMHDALLARWRGGGISVERLLLDLHSGRWLGRGGVWLMDAAAIVLIVLAASGAWSALHRPRHSVPTRREAGDAP